MRGDFKLININKLDDEKAESYTTFMLHGEEYLEYKTEIRCSNTKCREHKPLDKFHKNRGSRFGIQNQCKECKAKQYNHMKAVIYKMNFKAIEDYTVEYYGSSSSYEQRERNHRSKLKKGTHENSELQIEFNKLVDNLGLVVAVESMKFETIRKLTDVEKKELSSKGKKILTNHLLVLEKEVNDARIQEVKENNLNVKVVS